jgi:integrase
MRTTPATEGVEIEVFTREEISRLWSVVQQDWPAWYPFLLTLARAGLRLGEAVGLEWRDVDFDERVLIVRRTINHRQRRMRAPKNGKGRRVDLSRQLAATLRNHKSFREAEGALAGTPLPERVFSTPAGGLIRDDAFRRDVWARILRRATLRYRKPYAPSHFCEPSH